VAERLFFALWPGEAERAALARLQRDLLRPGARATDPTDLHLTLAFLGTVPLERRACCEAAGDGIRALPFDLNLARVGYWPRPRILWCGPLAPPAPLLALVRDLTDALRPCGFPGERRPYAAHITLARKVAGFQGPAPPADAAWRLDWPITDFVLAASSEGPPPRYRVVRRWSFQNASPDCLLCDNAGL
jgi:RNA 2',3'-cyclic 3'-phosphodiesterase